MSLGYLGNNWYISATTIARINPKRIPKRIPQSPQKIEQHLRAWTQQVRSQTQQVKMSSARRIPRKSKLGVGLFGNNFATIAAADVPTRLTPARKSPQKISLPACLWSLNQSNSVTVPNFVKPSP